MKPTTMLVAGFTAGIAFVVACHRAGSSAHAGPNDCAVWEFTPEGNQLSTSANVTVGSGTLTVSDLPAGWEPFAVDSNGGDVYVRRCKP